MDGKPTFRIKNPHRADYPIMSLPDRVNSGTTYDYISYKKEIVQSQVDWTAPGGQPLNDSITGQQELCTPT